MFVIANVISKQALGDWGLETFTAHHLTPSWPDGSLYATVNPCCSCKEMLLLVWLLLSLLFGRCLFFFFFPSTSSFVPVFANTVFYCDGKRLCSSCNTHTHTFSPSISDTVWKAFCNALCEEHCVPVSAFAYWAVQCIPITTGNVTIQCPLHFAETTCEKQVASCYHTTCDGSVSLLSWNFLALPFWMGEEKMDKKSCSFCGIPANLRIVTLRLTLSSYKKIFLPHKDLVNSTESIHKVTNLCVYKEKGTPWLFHANINSFL